MTVPVMQFFQLLYYFLLLGLNMQTRLTEMTADRASVVPLNSYEYVQKI
jgi:hypothetical protein